MTVSCVRCDRPVPRRGQACDQCIADYTHASRAAQGLEPVDSDPVRADTVARILTATTQPAVTARPARKARAS